MPPAINGGREAAVAPAAEPSFFVATAEVLFFGSLYVMISAGMISFNKHLMKHDNFPFAGPLVFMHMVFCACLTGILYFLMPSMFPSLSDPARRVPIDSNLMLKGVAPIAVIFCVQLVLTNSAYTYSSVAFLQMMKEANLVLVYTFSLLACLEKFAWKYAFVLVAILCATTTTIHGEVNFSKTGFVLQGTSQIFESTKTVMQGVLLHAAGWKLDPLTYVLVLFPCSATILGTLFAGLAVVGPVQFLHLPPMATVYAWWPMLLANCCLAFSLNVVVAFFVKSSGPVAFILAGIVKDVMIVCAGDLVFGEHIATIQCVGFSFQLMLIVTWGCMKKFPEQTDRIFLVGRTAPKKAAYGSMN